jgi:hypothetical protein
MTIVMLPSLEYLTFTSKDAGIFKGQFTIKRVDYNLKVWWPVGSLITIILIVPVRN